MRWLAGQLVSCAPSLRDPLPPQSPSKRESETALEAHKLNTCAFDIAIEACIHTRMYYCSNLANEGQAAACMGISCQTYSMYCQTFKACHDGQGICACDEESSLADLANLIVQLNIHSDFEWTQAHITITSSLCQQADNTICIK